MTRKDSESGDVSPHNHQTDADRLLIADGGTEKVIGKLADSSGVGVYGYATSSTGTTCGVKGEVDSSDGYGLATPDDAKIEGAVDTAGSDFVVTTNSGGETANVVVGHEDNEITDAGVAGGTIGGGGDASGSRNRVHADYSTVSGGVENQAGDPNAPSVGANATVGGGFRNTATANSATAAGGVDNDATSTYATVGGGTNNEASGTSATVPGGDNNTASGQYGFAAGRRAKATTDGSFVWADSTDTDFSSSSADQFLVEAAGGVGINQSSPVVQLHVTSNSGGDASHTGHTALIEDTDSSDSRGLAIRTGNSSGQLSDFDRYVSFLDTDNNDLGAITANSNDGVNYTSYGSDYAEYMPRRNPDEEIDPAEVVGVVGDAVTRRTAEADQAMVVSDRAVVTGNAPGMDRDDQEDHEIVAFVGQVPVKVRGPAEAGDLVVPSGREDGTGTAIAPDEWRPGAGPLVGRAWESDESDGVSKVTVAVGVDDPTLLGERLTAHGDRIDALEAENDELRDELDEKDDTIDRQAERIEDLEDRLATLEAQVGTTATPADD